MLPASRDPSLSWYTMLHAGPLRPLHTLVRAAEDKWRPVRPHAFRTAVDAAQEAVLARPGVNAGQAATLLREPGRGRMPTIVLGGFVPDSCEQVFLLRRFLLQQGDLYSVLYSPAGFSLDLLCAQLDDLLVELGRGGERPVLMGVSFGAGVVLEWLRRRREAGREPALGGVVLVSPVACVADILSPAAAKPATLLGRALKPLLDPAPVAAAAAVEKSRVVFTRMFEAGAQNKEALRRLMTRPELERLRSSVLGAIRAVTPQGAHERVQALAAMRNPLDYFQPALLPLTSAPALLLFAEREDAVLDAAAPSLFAFRHAHRAYFPRGSVQEVTARPGEPPVQHASLVFHVFEFLPPLRAFYARARTAPLPLAA
jgi:pimeloyl-ACP methyl ester carboxylesterase